MVDGERREHTHQTGVKNQRHKNTSHVCLARRLPPLNSNNECFLIFWIQKVFVSLVSERFSYLSDPKGFRILAHQSKIQYFNISNPTHQQ